MHGNFFKHFLKYEIRIYMNIDFIYSYCICIVITAKQHHRKPFVSTITFFILLFIIKIYIIEPLD